MLPFSGPSAIASNCAVHTRANYDDIFRIHAHDMADAVQPLSVGGFGKRDHGRAFALHASGRNVDEIKVGASKLAVQYSLEDLTKFMTDILLARL